MRKTSVVLGVLGAVVAIIVATGVVAFVRGGISARAEPSRLEVALARKARSWMIPSASRDQANPISASPRVLAEGRAHFADHCAVCHANDGSGNTAIGRGLYPRAPDMRQAPTQGLTDGEIYYVIENGVRLTGMPAWGGGGNPEASWHLVHFIRHLPELTPEELAEMAALNPKSPDEWRALEDDESFLRGEPPRPGRQPQRSAHGH
jgi:mono/diheme cytochrome c family protein